MRIQVILALALTPLALAWERVDHEIFDLHDVLSSLKVKSFYEVLDVPNAASPAVINKAYRQKSLQMHPDKTDNAGLNKLHTLLTSIAAILKDPAHREIYDGHLRKGFPVWRGSGYYYQKYKPGLGTVALLVALFVSVTQYLSSLAIFHFYSYIDRNEAEEREREASKTSNYKTELKKQLKRGVSEEAFVPAARKKPCSVTGKKKATTTKSVLMEGILEAMQKPMVEANVTEVKPAKKIVQETQPTMKSKRSKK